MIFRQRIAEFRILEEFLGDVMDEDDQSFTRKVFADRVKRKLSRSDI